MTSTLRHRGGGSTGDHDGDASSAGGHHHQPLDEDDQNELIETLRRDHDRYVSSTSKLISIGCRTASAASLVCPVLLLHLDGEAHHTAAGSLKFLAMNVPYSAILHVMAGQAARGRRFPPRVPFLDNGGAAGGDDRDGSPLSPRDETIFLSEVAAGSVLPIALLAIRCFVATPPGAASALVWDDAALVSMWALAFGNVLTAIVVVGFRWDVRSLNRNLAELDGCRYRYKSL